MKKTVLLFVILLSAAVLISFPVKAEVSEDINNSVEELKHSIDGDTLQRMDDLGLSGADITELSDLSLSGVLSMLGDTVSDAAAKPLSACILMTAVILLAALMESYTFSLRYVDTKDVMNVVTTLAVITVLVNPMTELIQSGLEAIRGCANLMLVYAPVMVGIMAMGGRFVRSGGYYATVMAASQGIAQLAGKVLVPLLNILLALSVSSAICERVKLNGICELLTKLIKWTLTFAMTVFTAILSIQGFAADVADSVASKAVRFTLSSVIPVVGGSISEAYKAIRGSVNLLRSGVGVFAVAAVLITFLPIFIQTVIWQLSVLTAKTVADTFSVSSVATVLNAFGSVLSVLTALTVVTAAVFLISSGVMISVGGAS